MVVGLVVDSVETMVASLVVGTAVNSVASMAETKVA